MAQRIHITGASGSGTSTLGRALAEAIYAEYLDTDDFFWLPGFPPCQAKRPMPQRLDRLAAHASADGRWVLSGSLCGWGDPLVPRFEQVIFLTVPTPLRLERLRQRERERHGAEAIAPGGAVHEQHTGFLAWAARYDESGLEDRSRARHEAWLAELPCPVLRLDGTRPVAELLAAVLD